jgi:hypothetical protein
MKSRISSHPKKYAYHRPSFPQDTQNCVSPSTSNEDSSECARKEWTTHTRWTASCYQNSLDCPFHAVKVLSVAEFVMLQSVFSGIRSQGGRLLSLLVHSHPILPSLRRCFNSSSPAHLFYLSIIAFTMHLYTTPLLLSALAQIALGLQVVGPTATLDVLNAMVTPDGIARM